MEQAVKVRKVFVSACEASADLHCANLIKAATKLDDTIEWVGIGGEKMADAGCELIANPVSRAAMIYNAFGEIGYFYKLIKQVKEYFASEKTDLVIVCDSPAFNFHIAKAAKKAGAKVLWYVAPQLWAWASWRIWKLRRRCDRLACILPFEKAWFSKRNMDVEFVGNPLFDESDIDIQQSYKDYAGFDSQDVKIAIVPGSRDAEIKTLYQPMQQIAARLKGRFRRAQFRVVASDDQKLGLLEQAKIKGLDCEFTVGDVAGACKWADIALVASGSATLQVAGAGCPMMIMYQSNKILWHLLGRWLIKTRFLSLVNILAGRELVSEFMPYFTSIEPIIGRCNVLLSNKSKMANTSRELIEMTKPLATGTASERVAQMAIEMLND